MTDGMQRKLSCPVCGSEVADLPYMGGAPIPCPSCGARLRIHRSKGVAVAGFLILFLLSHIASDLPLGWGIFALAAAAVLAWEYFSRTLVVANES